jgi:hypothetical protein
LYAGFGLENRSRDQEVVVVLLEMLQMKAQGQELGWDPEQFHQTVLQDRKSVV